jgi:tetratricopeptide (TPR) repeat protein
MPRPASFSSLKISFLLPALGLCAASCATDYSPSRSRSATGPLVRAMADLGVLNTGVCARLSVPSRPQGCDVADTSAFAGIIGARSDATPSVEVVAIASRAASALRDSVDLDAIHAAALVDLVIADTMGKSLDRSISYFEMLTRLATGDASPFVDLGAAHLAAAARGRDPSHLLDALDATSRALEVDESNAAASFNRALSLDLLGLDREAAREWERYLRGDSSSVWAAMARKRRAAITPRRPPAIADTLAPRDTLIAFAELAPFEARGFVWERLLGDWSSAIQSDQPARARDRLAAAGVIANVLVQRFGDVSLQSAVDDIRRAPIGARKLAHLHALYARGLKRTREHDHRAADSAYTEIMASADAPPTLRAWATHGHANSLVYAGALLDAIRLEQSLLRSVVAERHPSLAGRAVWIIAIGQLRLGRNSEGLAEVARARRFFAQAGEQENVYATIGVEGEVAFRSGNDDVGFNNTMSALRGLREYPTSTWRHNMLYILGGQAAVRGRQHAALAIEDEDLVSEQAAGRPTTTAESKLARARTLWSNGQTDRAQRAIDSAGRAISALPYADAHSQLLAELNLARASGLLRTQPATARDDARFCRSVLRANEECHQARSRSCCTRPRVCRARTYRFR